MIFFSGRVNQNMENGSHFFSYSLSFSKYFLSLGIQDSSFAAKVFNYMDTNKDGSVNKKGFKNFDYSTKIYKFIDFLI